MSAGICKHLINSTYDGHHMASETRIVMGEIRARHHHGYYVHIFKLLVSIRSNYIRQGCGKIPLSLSALGSSVFAVPSELTVTCQPLAHSFLCQFYDV